MIGVKKGKVWGETTQIFKTANVEVHCLRIKKGGYCSEHKHKKSNLFYIIRGKLKISVWDGSKLIDETVLTGGQMTTIQPGLWHMFEALENTECIEVYEAQVFDNDIERRTTGGLK